MLKKNPGWSWEIDTLNGELSMVEAIETAVASRDIASMAQLNQYLAERKTAIETRRTELLLARSSDVVAHLLDDNDNSDDSEDEDTPTRENMPLSYSQIYAEIEKLYSIETPYRSQVAAVIDKQDLATRRAWAVLKALNDRGGFDHWFENIDNDIQDEIFEELRKAVEVE